MAGSSLGHNSLTFQIVAAFYRNFGYAAAMTVAEFLRSAREAKKMSPPRRRIFPLTLEMFAPRLAF
jgi:hypothetical protein